jgi:signal transduction histidine kinase
MEAAMVTSSATPTGGTPPLRRDPGRRMLGGVCAGLADRLGVDPLLVRVAFVAAAMAGGLGIALYALAWVAIPVGAGPVAPRRLPGDRGSVEVALGVALLLLSVLLAFRELGIWFSDAVVWPLLLVAAGGALLWRQSTRPADKPQAAPVVPAPAATPAEAVRARARMPAEAVRERARTVSRTGLGVALVIAAGLAFLQATGSLVAARDVVLAVLVAVIVLGVIFAPWILRLVRSLSAERAERIRSQERAEMAAHLHDSVLQTLAMVQRGAGDPRQVAALARRQERELRAWLSGRAPAERADRRLVSALEATAAEVEEAHGVQVDVVAVGDRELDPATGALVAAAREAMVNAAKFGGGSPVAVYAEASDGRTHVFVRDRGPGFDTGAIPPDRRGIRESIVGRMERNGGRARVTSAPGAGTEVELVLESGST